MAPSICFSWHGLGIEKHFHVEGVDISVAEIVAGGVADDADGRRGAVLRTEGDGKVVGPAVGDAGFEEGEDGPHLF